MKNANAKAKHESTNRDGAVLRPAAEVVVRRRAGSSREGRQRTPGRRAGSYRPAPSGTSSAAATSRQDQPQVLRRRHAGRARRHRPGQQPRPACSSASRARPSRCSRELLSAAISGTSTNAIQGSAGTTEDSIKYSWNYALLLAEGPSLRALVASPLYVGMRDGLIGPVRGDHPLPARDPGFAGQRALGKSHDGAGAATAPTACCMPGRAST